MTRDVRNVISLNDHPRHDTNGGVRLTERRGVIGGWREGWREEGRKDGGRKTRICEEG